jgi:hypothetical protein
MEVQKGETVTNSWKILAVIAVVGLLALVGLMATIAFAGTRTPQFAGWGTGGMMGAYGGGMMGGYNGMMGSGPMGPGMMGQGFGGSSQIDPLPVEEATAAVQTYLARLGNSDLAAGEVMVFSNHAYAQVVEKSAGSGAFEVLVDPVTRAVTPEPGPNMMWNLKYGPMAGFGGSGMIMGGYQGYGMGRMMDGVTPAQPSAEMPVSQEEAIQTAQRYLDAYLPGTQAEDAADSFYGYYTIHVLRDGQTVGMLSVNGYTQEVFVHFWHGEFVDMAE